MNNLEELIDFVRFTHEIRSVRRAMMFEGNSNENDMEHQYQLALVGWFLADNDELKLDKNKLVSLALVHDIAEVYAGDLIAFASPKDRKEQKKREKDAILKLQERWPSFSSMHELIEEYEHLSTEESKFIYALDKLLPMINNYIFEGKAWKKHNITLEKLKDTKKNKVSISNEVDRYYREIIKLFERKPELFGIKK
jgi:putative hydrolase of HD superfamily